MAHLTEDNLIKYAFDLLTEDQHKEFSAHLDQCSDCKDKLDQLQRKFSALDLLKGDPEVSEKLIADTLASVNTLSRPKIFKLRYYSWLGAAAAVLMIGLMLVMTQPDTPKSFQDQFAKDNSKLMKEDISPTATEFSERDKFAMAEGQKSDSSVVLKDKLSAPVLQPTQMAMVAKPTDKVDTGLFEKPPFAPASAIELVTLPSIDDVQLTIYNSADLTLVRQKRNLTLKEGWNWLQFMWANTLIDPTSLSLTPLKNTGHIDVQQLVYPARLKDIGRWLIRSEITGSVPFEITYFTSGLSWRAFYMGTMSPDEKTMNLKAYVRVANSSGEDYPNAQTRLIVGEVNLMQLIADLAKRQYPYDSPVPVFKGQAGKDMYDFNWWWQDGDALRLGDSLYFDAGYGMMGGMGGGALKNYVYIPKRKEIKKEGLSEYFLYTIEGTETIPDQFAKRLPSLNIDDIPIESLYKYDEQRYGRNAVRFVSFANDAEHKMGQTPIPNGNVRIYRNLNETRNLSYIGGTDIKYIPVDEDIELNLGPARLVKVEPKLMDFKTDNYIYDRNDNIAGWDEIKTYTIELTNARPLPVEIEITRGFETSYWTIEFNDLNVNYEKHDAEHARFTTSLEPETKTEFQYTVTTYHGKRQSAVK